MKGQTEDFFKDAMKWRGAVQVLLSTLQDAGCIFVDEDGKVESQTLGRIASFYYLKYQTLTVFTSFLQPAMPVQEVTPPPKILQQKPAHDRDA